MNIAEYIKNKGKTTIQNPNYNPKSKKNKVPQFIEVPNLEPTTSFFSEGAQKEAEERIYVPEKEVDKYGRHGIQWNQYEANNGSLDRQLADAQGGMTKLGNGLAQALVSEIGLGTLRGFSDLIDSIGQAVGISDKDYSNPISRKLEEWQEKFNNEVAPIYTTPGVDISNGGLTDMGWWASNMPSIMSSLTLLLPSTAAMKTISWAGKAAKASKLGKAAGAVSKATTSWLGRATRLENNSKINKLAAKLNTTSARETRRIMGESAMTGTLSRVMENYQEARQTYTDMYNEASDKLSQMTNEEYAAFLDRNSETIGKDVDTNDRNAVAKAIARKSADETFKLDFANTAFDIWQIYALRNIPLKGMRKSSSNRGSVNIKNKDSIKYAGMSVEEKAEAIAKRSKWANARTKAWDYTVGSASAFGAQLSEGVEEAVNYIAQQEGMTLGHVMLGMEDESSFWDNRLKKYANNPALWESAFWGVMGGVVFQGLGSSFNRARGAIEGYREAKKKGYGKTDDKSKETLQKPSWSELWQKPEIKRRLNEIDERDADFRNYLEMVKKIDEGFNPYDKDEHGVSASIDPNSKNAELLREKAYNDMVTRMTLRALDTGNYDMLREFLTSEEVKKAIIDKGVMSQEEANKIQQDVTGVMDHIVELYDSNLERLNAMSGYINRQRANGTDEKAIPVEILQLIARENIDSQLSLEEVQSQLAAWELTKQQQEAFYRGQEGAESGFDATVPYQDTIRLRNLTYELGRLLAEKKALQKDKTRLHTISGQQRLEELNNNIRIATDIISEINPDQKRAHLLFAMQNAQAYEAVIGADKKVSVSLNYDSKDYLAFREKVVNMDKDILAEYGEDFANLSEADFGQLSVVDDNQRRTDRILKEAREQVAADKKAGKPKGISNELIDAYNAISDLMIGERMLRDEVVNSEDKLRQRVSDINNFLNEARSAAIDQAIDTLENLADKHGIRNIRYALLAAFETRQKFEEIKGLTRDELKTLNDVLDVLRLDKDANENLFTYVDGILEQYADVRVAQGKKNTVNKNQSSTSQNAGSNNISSQQGESNTSQENGSSGNSNRQPLPKPKSNAEGEYLSFRYNADGEIEAVINLDNKQGRAIVEVNNDTHAKDDTAAKNEEAREKIEKLQKELNELTDDPDGTKRVELERDLAKAYSDLAVTSEQDYMFTTGPGVSMIDDNYIIGSNPIVEVDENGNISKIVRHGILVVASQENTEAVAEQEAEAAEEQQAQGTQPAPAVAPRPTGLNPDEVAAASASSSSTGEVLNDVAPVPEVTPVEELTDEIRNAVVKQVRDNNLKKTDTDWGGLKEYLREKHQGKLEDESQLNAIIDKCINQIKTLAERLKKPESAEVAETVLKASAIREDSKSDIKEDFDKSINRLVKKYAKEVAADYIDGKYYISLTDLLRYCNQVCETNEAANLLYQALTQSLRRNPDKYVITEQTFEDYVANSKIDNSQRTKTLLNINGVYGINHDGLLRDMIAHNSPDVSTFYRILDNLKPGQKIDYVVNQNHIDFMVDGFRIGYLPIPSARKDNGVQQTNDELITDITENPDGTISSKLKDLLTRWVDFDASADIKDLNDIICTAAFNQLTDKEKKDLADKLLANKEVQDAIKNGNIQENPDGVKLLEGLAKIWRFNRNYVGRGAEATKKRRAQAIDDWFTHMVAPSFNMVFELEVKQSGTVTLASISEGEIIHAKDNKPIPISKAIGSNHKGKVRIAVSKREGELTVAGKGVESSEGEIPVNKTTVKWGNIGWGIGRGRTALVFPSRNGNHEYVHMFPRTIASMTSGNKSLPSGIAPVFKAIQDEVKRLIDEPGIAAEKSDRLEAYLRDLFSGSQGHTPLMWGVVVSDFIDQNSGTKIGFTLSYKDNKGQQHNIRFSHQYNNGRGTLIKAKNLRAHREDKTRIEEPDAVTSILQDILQYGQFNIGTSFIESDNDKRADTKNNMVYRDTDGKFVIEVNGKEFKFNSFNDFIIENDLVSVNTQPSEDGKSNFRHISDGNQSATQNMKVKLDTGVSTSPKVETKKEGLKTTADKVRDILNDKSNKDKGKAIAKLILGDRATNLRIGKTLGRTLPINVKINDAILSLFPKNIIFVDQYLGNNTNAFTNVGTEPELDEATGITVQPGQVVVGREFMDMINGTVAQKQEAIRKLIHEQLHLIIHSGNEDIIDKIRPIYNKFKSIIGTNDSTFSKYLFLEDRYQENGNITDEGLEEFLVETLTSEELARKLNEIPSDETFENKKEKKSLFQAIMEKLAKIFNWPIKKGSLYYQEFQVLRDIVGTPVQEEQQKPRTPVQLTIDFKDINQKADEAVKSGETSADTSSPVERNDEVQEQPATLTPEPAPEPTTEDNAEQTQEDADINKRTKKASKRFRRFSSRTENTSDYTDEMNPNQVKSATDNNGEFSTTDNNIRRSSLTEVPSAQSLVDRIPLDEQAKLANKLNNGTINFTCR